jgi:hypothetical protein
MAAEMSMLSSFDPRVIANGVISFLGANVKSLKANVVTFHCVASDKEPSLTYEKKKVEVAKELEPAPLPDATESERRINELLRRADRVLGSVEKGLK